MDYKIAFKKKRLWHGIDEKYFTFTHNGKNYKGYIMPHCFFGNTIVTRIWEKGKFLGLDYSMETSLNYAYEVGAEGLIQRCFVEMISKEQKRINELNEYTKFFNSIGKEKED